MKKTLLNKCFAYFAIAAAGMAITATDARSAVIFTETAGNAFYDSGWSNGSSQPLNFSWITTTSVPSGYAGHFVGDSKNLSGGSGGDINTAGRSWGMYGANGAQSDAFGFLKDGAGNNAPLSVGQTLSVDIAVNWRNGYKGFAARNGADTEIFTLNVAADDHIVYNAATGNGSIGIDYSINTVFSIAMTQTNAGDGTWKITRSGGVSDVDTGTYSGVISNFKLYVGDTVSGSENDLMVNNISVGNISAIPEPGVGGLPLVVGGLLTFFRRRQPPLPRPSILL